MYNRSKEIPAEDGAILERTYAASDGYQNRYERPEPKKRDTKEFPGDVNWRIYTEWCIEGYPGAKNQRECYKEYGDLHVFEQWIARETHFALERILRSGAVGEITHDTYLSVRTQVVEAAGLRALELFQAWQGPYSPQEKDDKRNLRASLQPYLEQQQKQVA